MDNHIRAVAALHIVCGLLTAALALCVAFFLSVLVSILPSMNGEVGTIVGAIGGVIVIPFLLLGIGEMVAGICLFGNGKVARGFCIAFGILQLINIPIGTAVGAYTLWALLRSETPAPAV